MVKDNKLLKFLKAYNRFRAFTKRWQFLWKFMAVFWKSFSNILSIRRKNSIANIFYLKQRLFAHIWLYKITSFPDPDSVHKKYYNISNNIVFQIQDSIKAAHAKGWCFPSSSSLPLFWDLGIVDRYRIFWSSLDMADNKISLRSAFSDIYKNWYKGQHLHLHKT